MKDEHSIFYVIKVLREHFACEVGYVGHEAVLAISFEAAMGIYSFERHTTLD